MTEVLHKSNGVKPELYIDTEQNFVVLQNMSASKDSDTETVAKKAKVAEIKDLINNEEYAFRKRLPRKLPTRKCDVYVTRKTDFKGQLARCQKKLDDGNVVYVHGLGAAVNRAINLALQLKQRGLGSVELDVHTSTVELTDDLEPLTDEHDADTMTRNNSAVHIRVFRPEIPNLDDITESDAFEKDKDTVQTQSKETTKAAKKKQKGIAQ